MNRTACNQLLRIFLLILFLPLYGFGQTPNTLVKGTINNNLAKFIEIQVNQKYLNDVVDLYKTKILADGTYEFDIEINEPQLAKIIYARNEALIYLEPNDTLVVNAEAGSFQYSLKFAGKGGSNNTIYQKHLKNNPPIMNAWQLTQYQKGIFWFANDTKMDTKMQRMKESQFTSDVSNSKNQSMSNLLRYQNEASSSPSQDFIEFLETEIYYEWAYSMLLYGSVYNHMHQLDENTFFSFLEDIPVHDKKLGSYWYRNFLLAYVNHKSMKQNKEGG